MPVSLSVVLFSNVPLGTWVAMRVLRAEGMVLRAVVCERRSLDFRHHGLDYECVYDFATRFDIPIVDLSDLRAMVRPEEAWLGLTVRFPRILRRAVFDLFSRGVINFHGGELPRWRGANIANFSVLEGAARGAGTLHFIDEGLDTGAIIQREYFEIGDRDTAWDVFQKTHKALMVAFDSILPRLCDGALEAVPQQVFVERGETARTYRTKELEPYRVVRGDMPLEEIERVARAFAFPDQEPAYFDHGGRRVYVTTRWEGKRS